jgi:uncharacterized protein
MGPVNRQILIIVIRLIRSPKVVLAAALLLAGISVMAASKWLAVSTDENKLFSPKVAFFHQYLTFVNEFPENEAAYVVLQPRDSTHPPPVERWIQAADAITAALQALPNDVERVDSHIPLKRLNNQALLFADGSMVRQVADGAGQFTQLAELWGQPPTGLMGLLGPTPMERFVKGLLTQNPSAETAAFVAGLATCWNESLSTDPVDWTIDKQLPDISSLLPQQQQTPATFGYYYIPAQDNPSEHLLIINVYPKFTYDSLAAISAPLENIKAAMLKAAAPFAADFSVGLTGRPVLSADEMSITTHDANWAQTLAMIVVLIGLILMLRSTWLGLAAAITLSIAIAWTFGLATLVVGHLNLLSTIFVIALIGIGMDYLIQIVVRYRREAQRYERQSAIWMRVFRYAGPPVATACAGASGAFLVALLTDFRGDAELGIIAGCGLLLCLVSGYTVLPALLVVFPPRLRMVDPSRRYSDHRPPPSVNWHSYLGLIVWLAVLAALAPLALKIEFDPNLLNLQAPGLESVELIHKLPTWYAVVLAPELEDLAPMREKLNQTAANPNSVIGSTSSLLDAVDKQKLLASSSTEMQNIQWRPPPDITVAGLTTIGQTAQSLSISFSSAAGQKKSSANDPLSAGALALSRFAQTIHNASPGLKITMARRLSVWQQRFVDDLQQTAQIMSPRSLDIDDLPPEVKNHFVSPGNIYALYIYPRFDLWQQSNLRAFVEALEGTSQQPGLARSPTDIPILTGIAVELYYSTKSIQGAFLETTILALVLVVILVFLDLRRIGQTLGTISVLLLGLPMLIGIMGLLGLKWNFANFFAMPILIGAGHEYGVFLMHRFRETLHNPRRIWRFWDVSEQALLLCAFVTCSSFGFLALTRDRGIASLGLIMAIGIGCIYLSAVFVVRPLLIWRLGQKGVYEANNRSSSKK